MEIQLNDYHKKVNAQKMSSMAYWREHPLSLEECLEEKHIKGCKLFRGFAIRRNSKPLSKIPFTLHQKGINTYSLETCTGEGLS